MGAGGAEQVLVELARVAPSVGMEMSVVSLMPTDGRQRVSDLRAIGVPVASAGVVQRWDPRGIARAVRIIGGLRPDVVHTHLKHADLIGGMAAGRLRLPFVSTLHVIEEEVHGIARVKRSMATAYRARRAARTIAVSSAVASWYATRSARGQESLVTIHNGVAATPPLTAAARAAVRASLGVTDDVTLLVLAVGVMRPGKGHEDLVAVAARLPRDLRARVVIVGDGELRPAIEGRIQRAGLSPERIHLAGYRDDVPQVLAAADVVVHPSHEDALPTVLLSALSAGRPIVATTAGGIPEIVDATTGLLVTPGDVTQIIRSIEILARDADRRLGMGVAAQERFAAEFEASRWAERLRALYDEVLAERRQPCA
jgi:glycosyltransferase involved in cell wall biosynthesis